MDSIRTYLISVTAAAFICGMVTKLVHKGTLGSAMKLLTGLFMALTVLSPLLQLRLDGLKELTLDIQMEASDAAEMGKIMGRQEMETIISDRTRAYILDKAEELGLCLSVEIELSGESYPVPVSVQLEGDASPYARMVLTDYISQTLGISAEEQQWNT